MTGEDGPFDVIEQIQVLHVRIPFGLPGAQSLFGSQYDWRKLREIGPDEFRQIELITMNELQEIRRLWRFEKHEFDDSVPRIYHEATGEEFPVPADDDNLLRGEDWQILKEVCGEDPMFFELQSSLLDVEREYRGMSRRAGIYEALEDRFKACQFESEQEALSAKQAEEELRKEIDKENERSLAIVQKSLFGEEEGDGV